MRVYIIGVYYSNAQGRGESDTVCAITVGEKKIDESRSAGEGEPLGNPHCLVSVSGHRQRDTLAILASDIIFCRFHSRKRIVHVAPRVNLKRFQTIVANFKAKKFLLSSNVYFKNFETNSGFNPVVNIRQTVGSRSFSKFDITGAD